MSVRLYIGNLPQNLKNKELEELFSTIGKGIRFKAVLDRETKACRGFGFANINDEKLADEVIEKLNGYDFNGTNLRVELSERIESNYSGRRNYSSGNSKNSPRSDGLSNAD